MSWHSRLRLEDYSSQWRDSCPGCSLWAAPRPAQGAEQRFSMQMIGHRAGIGSDLFGLAPQSAFSLPSPGVFDRSGGNDGGLFSQPCGDVSRLSSSCAPSSALIASRANLVSKAPNFWCEHSTAYHAAWVNQTFAASCTDFCILVTNDTTWLFGVY